MAPPKEGKKKVIAQKKEKLFHPQSRKAEQLGRVQHRKSKLEQVAKARSSKQRSQVDIYSFFYHAMPTDGVLSLEDLHKIIDSVWLTRFDGKLEDERKNRRKGRPKSVKEQKLEELKLREAEEYRTGLEVIDLTYPPNVELFRRWDRKAVEFIQQLRFIRISSDSPSVAVVSCPGKHPSLLESKDTQNSARDEHMDIDEAPLLMEPLSRFSSTITAVDGPSTS